ncbi:MAG TPA: CaiB/BaiF CoA-transferase family protein [Actinomycetota bacterium]|nr:CaiB/BaiF CoA-transferase family protein [Actinomycetota bacterium]
MSAPLEGVRVLDLTRLLPGGYATLLMADLGADVVKVEEPVRGDYIRWMPPIVDGESTGHRSLNRGKRSVVVNLKDPAGAALLRRLAPGFDVLVESFRPGVMDRLGVGPQALASVAPRLVYCAISGYGQDGPYRDRAGHDLNYIGHAGMLSLNGLSEGPPVVPVVQVGDLAGGGMAAVIGVLAALLERATTGRGRFVDTAMMDGVASWMSVHQGAFLQTGEEPRRGEMPLSGAFACYGVYECADGRWVTVGALEPQFWTALCTALELPELVHTQFGPPEQQHEMRERLAEVFSSKPRDEWLSRLDGLEVCVGPVNSPSEALDDPQFAHRGLVADVDGRPVGAASPFVMDGERLERLSPAPGLGEHTDEVLREAGLDAGEIERLGAGGVI